MYRVTDKDCNGVIHAIKSSLCSCLILQYAELQSNIKQFQFNMNPCTTVVRPRKCFRILEKLYEGQSRVNTALFSYISIHCRVTRQCIKRKFEEDNRTVLSVSLCMSNNKSIYYLLQLAPAQFIIQDSHSINLSLVLKFHSYPV